MEAIGVRFAVSDPSRFAALRAVFDEVKKDKDAGAFRNPEEWVQLVPDEVKARFAWPTPEERARWLTRRPSTVIAVPEPTDQLGGEWDFYRVFEAIEESEYDLLRCELVAEGIGEMHVNPWAYPYGGVGPFIALAEAFGFPVLGANECGRFESREELLRNRGRA